MFSMRLLCLAVALATRTGRALLRADAEALSATSRSPVEKVVKLLRDMQATLNAEAKEDEKLYEKLSCWCESGNKEKNANVDAAEAEVKLLESETEERTAAADQLAADVKTGYEDQAKLKESLANADGQRKEQYDAYRKDLISTRSDLELVKQAIYILHEHQAVSFPQIKVGLLGMSSTRAGGPVED